MAPLWSQGDSLERLSVLATSGRCPPLPGCAPRRTAPFLGAVVAVTFLATVWVFRPPRHLDGPTPGSGLGTQDSGLQAGAQHWR